MSFCFLKFKHLLQSYFYDWQLSTTNGNNRHMDTPKSLFYLRSITMTQCYFFLLWSVIAGEEAVQGFRTGTLMIAGLVPQPSNNCNDMSHDANYYSYHCFSRLRQWTWDQVGIVQRHELETIIVAVFFPFHWSIVYVRFVEATGAAGKCQKHRTIQVSLRSPVFLCSLLCASTPVVPEQSPTWPWQEPIVLHRV